MRSVKSRTLKSAILRQSHPPYGLTWFEQDYLSKLADKYSMTAETRRDFLNYVSARFPQEVRLDAKYGEKYGYIQEWADRFSSHREYPVSDGTGKKLLKKLNPQKYKEGTVYTTPW